MIIDMHAHTSQHKLRGLHTEDADIGDLKRYAAEYGIGKIMLMATYFPFKGTGLHNCDLHERIKGDSLFGFFGSIDLSATEPDFRELRSLAEAGIISGIKLYPGYQEFHPNNLSIMDQLSAIARPRNLPIAIHTGELHHCCPRHLREAGQRKCGHDSCPLDRLAYLAHPYWVSLLAGLYPRINFIACHMSNPHFRELRQAMAEYPNVFTDISGQFLSASDEDTDEYREQIVAEIGRFISLPGGIDRIMFGTDFPIQSYKDTISLVKALGLTASEEAKLLNGNAKRLLNIS